MPRHPFSWGVVRVGEDNNTYVVVAAAAVPATGVCGAYGSGRVKPF